MDNTQEFLNNNSKLTTDLDGRKKRLVSSYTKEELEKPLVATPSKKPEEIQSADLGRFQRGISEGVIPQDKQEAVSVEAMRAGLTPNEATILSQESAIRDIELDTNEQKPLDEVTDISKGLSGNLNIDNETTIDLYKKLATGSYSSEWGSNSGKGYTFETTTPNEFGERGLTRIGLNNAQIGELKSNARGLYNSYGAGEWKSYTADAYKKNPTAPHSYIYDRSADTAIDAIKTAFTGSGNIMSHKDLFGSIMGGIEFDRPEFSPEVISLGKRIAEINSEINSKKNLSPEVLETKRYELQSLREQMNGIIGVDNINMFADFGEKRGEAIGKMVEASEIQLSMGGAKLDTRTKMLDKLGASALTLKKLVADGLGDSELFDETLARTMALYNIAILNKRPKDISNTGVKTMTDAMFKDKPTDRQIAVEGSLIAQEEGLIDEEESKKVVDDSDAALLEMAGVSLAAIPELAISTAMVKEGVGLVGYMSTAKKLKTAYDATAAALRGHAAIRTAMIGDRATKASKIAYNLITRPTYNYIGGKFVSDGQGDDFGVINAAESFTETLLSSVAGMNPKYKHIAKILKVLDNPTLASSKLGYLGGRTGKAAVEFGIETTSEFTSDLADVAVNSLKDYGITKEALEYANDNNSLTNEEEFDATMQLVAMFSGTSNILGLLGDAYKALYKKTKNPEYQRRAESINSAVEVAQVANEEKKKASFPNDSNELSEAIADNTGHYSDEQKKYFNYFKKAISNTDEPDKGINAITYARRISGNNDIFEKELNELKQLKNEKAKSKETKENVLDTTAKADKVAPSEEEQIDEILNGNVVSSSYDSEEDIPEGLKNKISSVATVDGNRRYNVTIAKSLHDYVFNNKITVEVTNPFDVRLIELGWPKEAIENMTMEQKQDIVINKTLAPIIESSSKVDAIKENNKQERIAELNKDLDKQIEEEIENGKEININETTTQTNEEQQPETSSNVQEVQGEEVPLQEIKLEIPTAKIVEQKVKAEEIKEEPKKEPKTRATKKKEQEVANEILPVTPVKIEEPKIESEDDILAKEDEEIKAKENKIIEEIKRKSTMLDSSDDSSVPSIVNEISESYDEIVGDSSVKKSIKSKVRDVVYRKLNSIIDRINSGEITYEEGMDMMYDDKSGTFMHEGKFFVGNKGEDAKIDKEIKSKLKNAKAKSLEASVENKKGRPLTIREILNDNIVERFNLGAENNFNEFLRLNYEGLTDTEEYSKLKSSLSSKHSAIIENNPTLKPLFEKIKGASQLRTNVTNGSLGGIISKVNEFVGNKKIPVNKNISLLTEKYKEASKYSGKKFKDLSKDEIIVFENFFNQLRKTVNFYKDKKNVSKYELELINNSIALYSDAAGVTVESELKKKREENIDRTIGGLSNEKTAFKKGEKESNKDGDFLKESKSIQKDPNTVDATTEDFDNLKKSTIASLKEKAEKGDTFAKFALNFIEPLNAVANGLLNFNNLTGEPIKVKIYKGDKNNYPALQESATAFYDPMTNTIVLFDGYTMFDYVHELFHVKSLNLLDIDKVFNDKITALRTATVKRANSVLNKAEMSKLSDSDVNLFRAILGYYDERKLKASNLLGLYDNNEISAKEAAIIIKEEANKISSSDVEDIGNVNDTFYLFTSNQEFIAEMGSPFGASIMANVDHKPEVNLTIFGAVYNAIISAIKKSLDALNIPVSNVLNTTLNEFEKSLIAFAPVMEKYGDSKKGIVKKHSFIETSDSDFKNAVEDVLKDKGISREDRIRLKRSVDIYDEDTKFSFSSSRPIDLDEFNEKDTAIHVSIKGSDESLILIADSEFAKKYTYIESKRQETAGKMLHPGGYAYTIYRKIPLRVIRINDTARRFHGSSIWDALDTDARNELSSEEESRAYELYKKIGNEKYRDQWDSMDAELQSIGIKAAKAAGIEAFVYNNVSENLFTMEATGNKNIFSYPLQKYKGQYDKNNPRVKAIKDALKISHKNKTVESDFVRQELKKAYPNSFSEADVELATKSHNESVRAPKEKKSVSNAEAKLMERIEKLKESKKNTEEIRMAIKTALKEFKAAYPGYPIIKIKRVDKLLSQMSPYAKSSDISKTIDKINEIISDMEYDAKAKQLQSVLGKIEDSSAYQFKIEPFWPKLKKLDISALTVEEIEAMLAVMDMYSEDVVGGMSVNAVYEEIINRISNDLKKEKEAREKALEEMSDEEYEKEMEKEAKKVEKNEDRAAERSAKAEAERAELKRKTDGLIANVLSNVNQYKVESPKFFDRLTDKNKAIIKNVWKKYNITYNTLSDLKYIDTSKLSKEELENLKDSLVGFIENGFLHNDAVELISKYKADKIVSENAKDLDVAAKAKKIRQIESDARNYFSIDMVIDMMSRGAKDIAATIKKLSFRPLQENTGTVAEFSEIINGILLEPYMNLFEKRKEVSKADRTTAMKIIGYKLMILDTGGMSPGEVWPFKFKIGDNMFEERYLTYDEVINTNIEKYKVSVEASKERLSKSEYETERKAFDIATKELKDFGLLKEESNIREIYNEILSSFTNEAAFMEYGYYDSKSINTNAINYFPTRVLFKESGDIRITESIESLGIMEEEMRKTRMKDDSRASSLKNREVVTNDNRYVYDSNAHNLMDRYIKQMSFDIVQAANLKAHKYITTPKSKFEKLIGERNNNLLKESVRDWADQVLNSQANAFGIKMLDKIMGSGTITGASFRTLGSIKGFTANLMSPIIAHIAYNPLNIGSITRGVNEGMKGGATNYMEFIKKHSPIVYSRNVARIQRDKMRKFLDGGYANRLSDIVDRNIVDPATSGADTLSSSAVFYSSLYSQGWRYGTDPTEDMVIEAERQVRLVSGEAHRETAAKLLSSITPATSGAKVAKMMFALQMPFKRIQASLVGSSLAYINTAYNSITSEEMTKEEKLAATRAAGALFVSGAISTFIFNILGLASSNIFSKIGESLLGDDEDDSEEFRAYQEQIKSQKETIEDMIGLSDKAIINSIMSSLGFMISAIPSGAEETTQGLLTELEKSYKSYILKEKGVKEEKMDDALRMTKNYFYTDNGKKDIEYFVDRMLEFAGAQGIGLKYIKEFAENGIKVASDIVSDEPFNVEDRAEIMRATAAFSRFFFPADVSKSADAFARELDKYAKYKENKILYSKSDEQLLKDSAKNFLEMFDKEVVQEINGDKVRGRKSKKEKSIEKNREELKAIRDKYEEDED